MDIDQFGKIMRNAATVSQLTPDTFRIMYGPGKFAVLSVVNVEDKRAIAVDDAANAPLDTDGETGV